ncbi:hypothetical protein [Bradyrhizobium acaciae]|uniref:hypothetical protein n=1 Tax=Bradyrhizobium acaciae TaxID=2683706 RepID=UPI001E608E9C|nr:hypothetical protein [Bradyrhizobium acaciae]MCC8982940.1 hypothetical protein [Bradyrhizobium acaciae]
MSGPIPCLMEVDMMQKSTARSPQQQNGRRIEPSGKIVVSSVVSHASLIAAISDRNPIIAKRTTSDEDES